MGTPAMKDSGKRQGFETGAVRDTAEGKPRLELISPIFLSRLGEWLAKGAAKYAARNWEKGIPTDRSMASLMRHTNDYREGKRDEDHLAAIACNIMFIIHTEEMVRRGVLPKELADVPSYMGKPKVEPDELEYRYYKEHGSTLMYRLTKDESQSWRSYPGETWTLQDTLQTQHLLSRIAGNWVGELEPEKSVAGIP